MNLLNIIKRICIFIILLFLSIGCSRINDNRANLAFLSFILRLQRVNISPNAELRITPTTTLETSEAGKTLNFSIVLITPPKSNVTIPLASSNLNEGTINVPKLVFTTLNFNTPQTVTITGIDDFLQDGNIVYKILIGPIESADSNYHRLDPPDLEVVNLDNDIPGFTISSISGNTSELGTSATFTIFLNTQPTANITVSLSSSDTSEGTVNPSSLTFTPEDFRVPKIVTVTGVDDNFADGNENYSIQFGNALSADFNYNGMIPPPVSLVNLDVGEKRTFITNSQFKGNLGGISGADAKCNMDINKPSILPNQYKAFLAGALRVASVTNNLGDGQIDWVLKPNTKYFRSAGIILIQTTDANSLFPFLLTVPVETTSIQYFTGLNPEWTSSIGILCSDWANELTGQGKIGVSDDDTDGSISFSNPSCTVNQNLLCIQQ